MTIHLLCRMKEIKNFLKAFSLFVIFLTYCLFAISLQCLFSIIYKIFLHFLEDLARYGDLARYDFRSENFWHVFHFSNNPPKQKTNRGVKSGEPVGPSILSLLPSDAQGPLYTISATWTIICQNF